MELVPKSSIANSDSLWDGDSLAFTTIVVCFSWSRGCDFCRDFCEFFNVSSPALFGEVSPSWVKEMLGFLVMSISTLFCLDDFLGVYIFEDFSPSPVTSLTSPINGSILIELFLLNSPLVGVGGIGSTKSILPSSPIVVSFFLLILTGLP